VAEVSEERANVQNDMEYLRAIKRQAELGLSTRERRRYSLLRATLAAAENRWESAGFERECSRAIAARQGEIPDDTKKFYVPIEAEVWSLGRRDMTVATAAQGGHLVETENVGFIEMLRNRAVALRMGARELAGLVGNVTIPRQSGAATAVWLANEASTITESNQTLQQVTLTPKTIGGYTEVSRQLMLQSNPSAEAVVSADLGQVVALAVDAAVLNGSGASGQPTGIINTAGVGSVTGTSLAFDDILEFQTDVAGANVSPVRGGYATTPAVASLCIQRVKYTSTASPLWEGSVWDGTMQGFPAMASLQVPTATMLFGDWSQVLVGMWGSLQIDVNPFANFQAGILGIRAIVTVDVALRVPGAFSIATSIT
jgi:HK97 family phage major capsid protein